MKNQIALIIVLVFLNACHGGNRLEKLVAKNEKAIFQVFSYDEYGAPTSTGSGFFVNKDGHAILTFMF